MKSWGDRTIIDHPILWSASWDEFCIKLYLRTAKPIVIIKLVVDDATIYIYIIIIIIIII